MRHHVIISGTGRTGTTLLVKLLTRLGLDTGFTLDADVCPIANAGMEHDLRRDDAPYIVKNPSLCWDLPEFLTLGIVIDYAIIPIRALHCAAESRRDVVRRRPDQDPTLIPGGLWRTADPAAQETVLATHLYDLLHTLALHEIPTVLVEFPRLVHDRQYLFRQLSLPFRLDRIEFAIAFSELVHPELVHDFSST